jgi:tight adherence protein C
VIGALLAGLAALFLLLAVMPRPARLRAARSNLDFIRESTMDEPVPARLRPPVPVLLLRRVSDKLHVSGAWVRRQDLIEAGIDPDVFTPQEVMTLKILAAGAAVTLGVLLGSVAPAFLLLTPALAWFAFIAPSVYIARRRAARRARILAELPDIVGLLRAFLNAQVPLERALHLITRQITEADPSNLLAAEIRQALGDYGLGETIEESLSHMAERLGVEELKTVVGAIAQGKRLGSGMELILRDQELLVRLSQRNRATAAASQISTRLMGVLVGIYLPEFVILVMIPLFWGVMLRAFG